MSAPPSPHPTGPLLRLYLAFSRAVTPLAERHLRKRLTRGKENPDRWREKLGEASEARPEGALVWMHAVGLGEVLALRGLIEEMAALRPDLNFLVTSSARASGEVFARNRPANTQHQYLPLDCPPLITRFLDHWRPDLSVWAEQDLWPAFVVETARRGISLAMVNARMNARAYASRRRAGRLYGDLLARFTTIAAQDQDTATHLRALSGRSDVAVAGSLKAACAPLADHAEERARLRTALAGRELWLAASTHPPDEAVVLAEQARRFAGDAASLLIIAPRLPDRRDEIMAACRAAGLGVAQRSLGQVPESGDAVWLADSFGEMGLWYRLAPVSLIGGGFGATGGHNPWEAASLGSAILHGPDTANFAADYAQLELASATRTVTGPDDLSVALDSGDLARMAERASAVQAEARLGATATARELIALLEAR
ncbi:MAG: 3-deoxy-D-manno-octulosonic acid transferase [Cereibacter sphaeroides]|uniref:3-deoxy-D-manno-octulosonic acid transferase n=1 Tax=Cereibacter sphaeroides TaxID=1063 RepID=A0A2W5RYG1_CERSP|nr:MAG: 3-deoxy-D-manno-octulosonic acid transferase [Cereibacter sphaeroides]